MNAAADNSIAFIGGGNIARALIGGLINAGRNAAELFASDPLAAQRDYLARTFGVECTADNRVCAARGAIIVLAVKPQFIRAAVQSIAPVLQVNAPLLVSLAAGIRIADIIRAAQFAPECNAKLAVVRAMPNTPALINAGITGLYANAAVSDAQRACAAEILRAVGETIWVDKESLIDVVTAVSGGAPAYYFKLMELLTECAAAGGIDHTSAQKLAVQSALGAAKLAAASDDEPAALRAQVTSKGGTTQAALATMQARGLEDAVRAGVAAGVARAVEISAQTDANTST